MPEGELALAKGSCFGYLNGHIKTVWLLEQPVLHIGSEETLNLGTVTFSHTLGSL